jgi:phosphatidylinositol alpha-1,6-mannosyltransferase
MTRHLLVTNDFAPKTGGIQVYLNELWRRLEPGRASVLTASSHPDASAFDTASELLIERVAASTLYLPTPRALHAIKAAIERHQPDLVLFDPAWPLGLLGPLLSVPYGVILHGAEVTVPSRVPFVASTLRHVLRHASVAICAGGYPEAQARRTCAEFMPPIVQITPGVDVDRFHPLDPTRRDDVRRSMGFDEGTLLVSSFSRLVPRKGMDTLIRASAQLRESFPALRVAIGGTGRDQGRLEKLVGTTNAPVTFFGRLPDDDLSDWLGASDLMVMDCRSRWLGLEQEGFGMVFVEAAACGVAQVAGRSGGSHEAVLEGVTGTVVRNSRSVPSLVRAMSELLSDAGRRDDYARSSRDAALDRYDWNTLAARLSAGLAPFDHFEATKTVA